MHPVNLLFEEIYRDYWGIPQVKRGQVRQWRRTPHFVEGLVTAGVSSRRSQLEA